MSFHDALEISLLDHIFTDPEYTPPTTLYIALSSTTPAEDGSNITEPSAGAYARVSTTAATWNAAAAGAKDNVLAIAFPQATADWVAGADLTHFVLFTLSTGGVALAFGALGTPKPVLTDDTAEFAAGALVFTLN